ncbi:hypothetical protein K438DRAFT_692729 [Mycena galopus ATCC 62051]|nr:hypothetical protein K438DRAFT_692729 [Mycena galopus ATCC 62051]
MRFGGIVSVRGFEPPTPIGNLIVLRAARIYNLRFSDLRLSAPEMTFLIINLNLPLVRAIDAAPWIISEPALHSFLCRHPTLVTLYLRDRPTKEHSAAPPPPSLPFDALPKLEYILGGARLLGWILASPQPSPHLAVVTLELHNLPGTRDAYHAALRGLTQRPTTDTPVLQLISWAPWIASDFTAPAAPERTLAHVVDLRLTFKTPSRPPRAALLVEWLRLFPEVQQVSLFAGLWLDKLSGSLQKELPHLTITGHQLPSRPT